MEISVTDAADQGSYVTWWMKGSPVDIKPNQVPTGWLCDIEYHMGISDFVNGEVGLEGQFTYGDHVNKVSSAEVVNIRGDEYTEGNYKFVLNK